MLLIKLKYEDQARIKQPREIFESMKTISFGDNSLEPEYQYPELSDMPELLSRQTIKIKTVFYKTEYGLKGM